MRGSRWTSVLLGLVVAVCRLDTAQSLVALRTLNKDNFDKAAQGKILLVNFCAPWSEGCKELAPVFEAAADELVMSPVSAKVAMGRVDATANKKLAKKYKVKGYPTLRLFRDGANELYSGPQTKAGIVAHLTALAEGREPPKQVEEEESEPAAMVEGVDSKVLVFTEENFDIELKKHPLLLLEFYAPWCGHCQKLAPMFRRASQELARNDPPVALGKIDGTVPAHKKIAGRYKVRGYPTLIVFSDYGKEFEPLPNQYRSERRIIAYMQALATGDPEEVKALEKEVEENDAERLKEQQEREAEEPEEPEEEVMVEPEGSEVVVLDHTNYLKVITENELVLAEFYAPWCGHCKRLFPQFTRASVALAKRDPPIVLAKMDATKAENDAVSKAVGVGGFPTLKVFRGSMESAEQYKGERTASKIVEYMVALQEGRTPPAPTPPKPYVEPESSKVITLTDADYEAQIAAHPLMLLKIYAPWCGHCKKMAPEFSKASARLAKFKSPITLAKLDGTANQAAGSNLGVDGFPTLKVFRGSIASAEDYRGGRQEDDIVVYMEALAEGKEPPLKAPAWDLEPEGSPVLSATPENFESLLAAHKYLLLEFYAPWCPHCKALGPKYRQAAMTLATEFTQDTVALAKLDAADSELAKELGQKYNLEGYPTILLFSEGNADEPHKYSGTREVSSLVAFMRHVGEGKNPDDIMNQAVGAEDLEEPEGSSVVVLNDDIDSEIEKASTMIVFYYAPWCPHSKFMTPIYTKAAAMLAADPVDGAPVVLAKINTDVHQAAGQAHNITGYPTLKAFTEGFDPTDYTGDRSSMAIAAWARACAQGKDPSHKYSFAEPAEKAADADPLVEPADSLVLELDADSFDAALKEHPGILVEFYAPWCNVCQDLAPEYTKAAGLLADEPDVMLAKIHSRAIAEKYDVTAYPTVKVFRHGEAPADFRIPKYAPAIAAYARAAAHGEEMPKEMPKQKRKDPELTEEQKAAIAEAAAEPDGSKVIYVQGTAAFEGAMEAHETMLLEFYAPWCGHCKALTPEYTAASQELHGAGVALAKMDGTDPTNFEILRRFDVRGYPTLRVWAGGEWDEYHGTRQADGKAGLVKYMTAVSQGETPEHQPAPKKPVDGPSTPEPEDSKVIIFDGPSFHEEVKQIPLLLLEFYAPWCGHCKALQPHFTKASITLQKSFPPVALGKMDVTKSQNRPIADSFGVKGFPTLEVLRYGKQERKYDSGRHEDAIVQFMTAIALGQEPPQWEEPEPVNNDELPEPEGSKVIVLDHKNFVEETKKHPVMLVEFYAPWCGQCKRLKPEYTKAAKLLSENDPPVPLAKMDHTFQPNKLAVHEAGIQPNAYPYLRVMKYGEVVLEYEGGRRAENIYDWMAAVARGETPEPFEEKSAPAPAPIEEPAGSKVLVLDVDNFEDEIAKHPLMLIEFYAPWCKHCVKGAPKYTAAAHILSEANPPVALAKVDVFGTSKNDPEVLNKVVSAQFEVQGYPSFFIVKDGKVDEAETYDGGRTTKQLVEYMTAIAKGETPPTTEGRPEGEPIIEPEGSVVTTLDAKSFATYRDSTDVFAIFFYAPWCADCHEHAPMYREVAAQMAGSETPMAFSIIDWHAVVNSESELKEEYEIHGYPSIAVFRGGKSVGMYGRREMEPEALQEYLGYYQRGEKAPAHESMQAPEPIEEPKGSKVIQLTGATFDAELAKHPLLMVEFYAPWCGHCKALAPEYTEAAARLADNPSVALAKIDHTHFHNADIGERYMIEGFPTLKIFKNGGYPTNYGGARSADDIVDWMSALSRGEDPSADEEPADSKVLVLTAKTLNKAIRDHPLLLVEFYAPWCGHCKKLQPKYMAAAAQLHENGVKCTLAKIDATTDEGKTVATRFSIKGFPILKLFRDGDYSNPTDYRGGRTTASLVRHMTSAAAGKQYPSMSGESNAQDDNKKAARVPRIGGDAFDAAIAGGAVLMEFYEPACKSCLQVLPWLHDAGEWLKGDVAIAKVDVQSNGAIARRFGIRRLPALKLFNKNEMYEFPQGAPYGAENIIMFVECALYPDDECQVEVSAQSIPTGNEFSTTQIMVWTLAATTIMVVLNSMRGGSAPAAAPTQQSAEGKQD